MTTPVRLAVFAVALVITFGAAAGVGSAVGPTGAATPAAGDHTTDEHETSGPMDEQTHDEIEDHR